MASIDLNCDMGESFGSYHIGDDEALMDFVSSVNIACGFHGGDPGVMRKTVALAAKKKIAIGAHPGYPDLQGFGRREMKLSGEEVYELVLYQLGALAGFAVVEGTKLMHVKPHGALYNTAAKEMLLAEAIAKAVKDFDPSLVLVGLSGSKIVEAGAKAGLKTASEVFADRSYQDDGALSPRTMKGALIEDPEKAAEQALKMVTMNKVTSLSGKDVAVSAQTLCIHGDGKFALPFAKKIRQVLSENNVKIQHL